MKKIDLLFCLIPAMISGQQKIPTETTVIQCSAFHESKPLIELMVENKPFKELDKEQFEKINHFKSGQGALKKTYMVDNVLQGNMGTNAAVILQNWDAQSGAPGPLDPSGAASPTHYVQAVNSKLKIYTKTGGAVTGGGPINLASLWLNSSWVCDPVVLYDKYADRWFISQADVSTNKLGVAVSKTNDPTGGFYVYSFNIIPGEFPDFPKYSIWTDGYYATANSALMSGGKTTNVCLAFERQKMLTGDPNAKLVMTKMPKTLDYNFLPGDADGQLPPSGTPCPFFHLADDTWPNNTSGAEQISVYYFKPDWVTPANSSVTLDCTLPVTPFEAPYDENNPGVVPQPSSSQKLESMMATTSFRAQYRRWTNHNSLVFCHTVFTSSAHNQTGIRWYELRQDLNTNAWSIYQQATYAPADNNYRFLGSIAMNDDHDIGLAYAVSSTTVPWSLRFTGRLASDPLGTMTVSETTAATGAGAQQGTHRAGDYSHTSIDPDGLTFWHTGMYYRNKSQSRIYSFKFGSTIGGIEKNSVANMLLTSYQDGTSLSISGENFPDNKTLNLDLFDLDGRLLRSMNISTSKNFTMNLSMNDFTKGIYFIRAGNNEFQKVIKVNYQ